jgi:hypothetical protein
MTVMNAVVVVDVLLHYRSVVMPISVMIAIPVVMAVPIRVTIPMIISPMMLVAIPVRVSFALFPAVMVPLRGLVGLMICLVIPAVFAAPAVFCPSVAPKCHRKTNQCDADH